MDLASPDGDRRHLDKVIARLTAAADAAGLVDWSLSVYSTIARAAAASLQRSSHGQRPGPIILGKRAKQQFTGWVR